MLLINYYMPRLKKQLMFYPLVAVICYFILFFSLKSVGAAILTSTITYYILGFMTCFGALIFASRKGMEIDTMLPVDWKQRSVFVMVYTFIIVPAIVVLPMYLCYVCTWQWVVINPLFKEAIPLLKMFMSSQYILLAISSQLIPMAVCLYCVVTIKHNRIIMSIVWTIVANIVLFMIGAIYGGIIGFSQGFEDGFNGVERSQDEVSSMLVSEITGGMTPVAVFLIICAIFVVIMTCRQLKNRQI